MNQEWIEENAEITKNILDFYRLQVGVKVPVLEKLDEFLLVMNAIWRDTIEDLEEFRGEEMGCPTEVFLEVLNGYLNALGEETEKIFPGMENPFQPITLFSIPVNDYLPLIEAMRSWNGRGKDIFGVDKLLDEFEEEVMAEEFHNDHVLDFAKRLISCIQLKMVIRIEDLI